MEVEPQGVQGGLEVDQQCRIMQNKTNNQKISIIKKKQSSSFLKDKESQDKGYKPENPQRGSAGGGPILSP